MTPTQNTTAKPSFPNAAHYNHHPLTGDRMLRVTERYVRGGRNGCWRCWLNLRVRNKFRS